jgi:23S rRNA pseudouridine1911/1915/1917 synthase
VGADALDGGADGDDALADIDLSSVNARPRGLDDPVVRPGIVHRLDKDTSGLLVVAKHDAAHAALARQFQERTTRRRYVAVVWGVPDASSGTIETYLGRDPRNRKRMAVVPENRGKWARTHWTLTEPFGSTSLLEFRLETGRTHQIRVHAAHVHHPIFSDATYGGNRIRYGRKTGTRRAFFKNQFEICPRQALHAATLGFKHPETGEQMDFSADLPADMQALVENLRAHDNG